MRASQLFIFLGLVSSSLATSCYQTERRDAPFGAADLTTKNKLYALRQTICSSWSGSCNQVNNGPDGNGEVQSLCWNQSSDDDAMQAIIFGPNPTNNNTCWVCFGITADGTSLALSLGFGLICVISFTIGCHATCY
jgi:hypothetical protein